VDAELVADGCPTPHAWPTLFELPVDDVSVGAVGENAGIQNGGDDDGGAVVDGLVAAASAMTGWRGDKDGDGAVCAPMSAAAVAGAEPFGSMENDFAAAHL
jgi:hypothetical protein